jgi:hypothetical protein
VSVALVVFVALVALPVLVMLAVVVDRRMRRPIRQPVDWWSPPPPRRHARARR